MGMNRATPKRPGDTAHNTFLGPMPELSLRWRKTYGIMGCDPNIHRSRTKVFFIFSSIEEAQLA